MNNVSITLLEPQLVICSLPREHLRAATVELLPLMFFNDRAFVSYTETSNEASIILEASRLQEPLQSMVSVAPGYWRAIQIYEGSEAIGMHDSSCFSISFWRSLWYEFSSLLVLFRHSRYCVEPECSAVCFRD